MIMINIWGQPLSASEKKPAADSIKDVKKLIEDEIAETLNLASVDPNEIVVFQDRTGKLKTSNISLDDILTRQRDAADNSIALFQDGKLKPGAFVNTITDKLNEYDTEFNDHIKVYNNFRRNVVGKFFGNPISVLPSLADIKTSLDEIATIKTSMKELTDIKTSIEQQEIAADIVKNDLSKVFPQLEKINTDLSKLEKVKIPHPHTGIRNIVYVVESGTLDWIKDGYNQINFIQTVNGVYRFTIVSSYSFNISDTVANTPEGLKRSDKTNVNTTTRQLSQNTDWVIEVLTSTNEELLRQQISWVIEFIMET